MGERVILATATEVPNEIFDQLDLNKYNFVKNDKTDHTGLVGRGNQRLVYLVQEKKSLKVFVAKFRNYNTLSKRIPEVQDAAWVKSWSDLLNNPVEAKVEGTVLFQTYIEGLTLQQWLVTDPIKQLDYPTWISSNNMKTGLLFEGSEKSLYVKEKLILFYCRMILNGRYVSDLNNENIIFSEIYDDWIIIDGMRVYTESKRKSLIHFKTRFVWTIKHRITDRQIKRKIENLIEEIKQRITNIEKNNYKFNEN
jgi:Txe/YoeB family toxin of Txe-Axe toxin-antitoxin module